MKTKTILATLIAVFSGAVFAEDVKNETAESKATADAKAVANGITKGKSVVSTNVNGKKVTIVEDLDENGKLRRQMITYSPSGKPKIKDLSPKEKQPVPAEKKAGAPAEKQAGKKNGGEEL